MTRPNKPKWHRSNTELVYQYIASGGRSMKGLQEHLGVSKQGLYDWCHKHDEFRDAVHQMRHMALSSQGPWAQDYVDPEYDDEDY